MSLKRTSSWDVEVAAPVTGPPKLTFPIPGSMEGVKSWAQIWLIWKMDARWTRWSDIHHLTSFAHFISATWCNSVTGLDQRVCWRWSHLLRLIKSIWLQSAWVMLNRMCLLKMYTTWNVGMRDFGRCLLTRSVGLLQWSGMSPSGIPKIRLDQCIESKGNHGWHTEILPKQPLKWLTGDGDSHKIWCAP